MVLILELVVTVGTRGCLQLRYEALSWLSTASLHTLLFA